MRRYLTLSEAESALRRGKNVEQFLGGYLASGDAAIRYAVIRFSRGNFIVNVFERFEPEQVGFFDVGEFSSVLPDDDPEDISFVSFDDAVAFLTANLGASSDKFVNQASVDDEYRDFRLAKEKP